MSRRRVHEAWRSLQARPGLTATVVLSLAIGLGANALLFAVADGAIVRPFPFPEPDRLVGVGAAHPKLNRPLSFFEALSGPEYVDIRSVTSLRDVTAFDLGNEPVVIGDTPERVFTAFVWDDPLRAIGLPPAMGRSFSAEELRTAAPVAVVSHTFWQTQLGGDPGAVGRTIQVAGRPHTVVGVMPQRTRFYDADLWLPMSDAAATLPRNRRQFNVVARLAPGVTLQAANLELEQLARRLDTDHRTALPEYEGLQFSARPWTQIEVWGFSGVTFLVFGAVGLLLLLVTANLASLLAARSATRRGEMAVRAALGADRRILVTQLATEALLQTAAGAIIGILLAWLGIRALPALLPSGFIPADAAIGLSPQLLLFVLAIAGLAALLVSLAPAWQLARIPPIEVLNADAGRSAGGRSTRRLHSFVVAFEVAAAVVITGSATLLALHTGRLLQVDRGFESANTLIARFTLPLTKYDGITSLAFFDTILERVKALPDVLDATLSNQPPPGVFSRTQFAREGRPVSGTAQLPSTFYTNVGPRYTETLGVTLLRGRWLNDAAPVSAPREVVINETLAARYFNGEDPIGQRVRVMGPANDGTPADIVGLVADVRNAGLAASIQPEMFVSVRQIPDRRRTQLYLVVRGKAGDVMATLPDIRAIVKSVDAGQPMYAISTLDAQFEGGVATRRTATWLLGIFSALTLGLSGLGLFGVLWHGVSERQREIGLRFALGADGPAVMRLMLWQAMRPVFLGLTAGLVGLVAGRQVLSGWLYGITPQAAPLVMVAAVVLLVSVVASAWPVIRASRLSPLEALTPGRRG